MHKVEEPKRKSTASTAEQKPSPWARLLKDLENIPASMDLARVLQNLVKLMQNAVPEHAAGIFLIDEETRTIQGQVTDLFDQDLSVGEGALQKALRNPASFVISSLASDIPPREIPQGVRTQIVVPFRASPQVRGALVLRSKKAKAYSQRDGEALSAFAIEASSVIESALIHQKVLQETDGEVERDLVMAHEIMARLMPKEAPKIPGFDVASISIPAKTVGGDLLDFICRPDDHYGFLVADASGNGIPSALLMTGFRALFRGLIQIDFNMRSVFRNVNQQLVESTAPHQFVSAFYASVDATTGRLIYVNGGHVPPLLLRPGQPVRRLDVGGPVLGILEAASYHEDSGVFHPQDILICYSDGLSEAESPSGEAFGEDHIIQIVEQNKHLPAEVICHTLREEAAKLVGSNLRDDLTICVIKYL
jgi:sigma-B regulation protein RsbU (phosphoserine phosphatase)